LKTALEACWREVLDNISETIGEKRFSLWFKDTTCIAKTSDTLTIGVPSLFVANWLRDNFLAVVSEAVRTVEGSQPAIRLKVDGKLFRKKRSAERKARSELIDEGAPQEKCGKSDGHKTLDDFVVGPCNEMAFVACRHVGERGETAYHPLFIHGSVGLGKTHLLQGIDHALQRRRVHRAFISGERFTNQFIYALRNGNIDAFRRKFREIDVLIIDDVHFLANKTSTQEEFLHTFNCFDGQRKQVVLTSDIHPRRMRAVSEAIVSRFVSGMVVELKKPDKPTRLTILRAKCAKLGRRIDDRFLDYIATNVTSSVRELEGALTNVTAYASLVSNRLTLASVKDVLANFLSRAAREVLTPEDIKAAVAVHFGLTVGDLTGRKRSRSVSVPRQVAMYLCRSLTGASYKEIGLAFDGRDHAAIMSSCKRASALMTERPELRNAVDEIRAVLGAG